MWVLLREVILELLVLYGPMKFPRNSEDEHEIDTFKTSETHEFLKKNIYDENNGGLSVKWICHHEQAFRQHSFASFKAELKTLFLSVWMAGCYRYGASG